MSTLADVVRDALIGRDPETAEAFVLEQIGEDQEALLEAARVGIHYLVRRSWHDAREDIRSPFDPERAEQAAQRASRARSAIAGMFYDYPLIGGMKLGDATDPELAKAETHYTALAKSCSFEARWLGLIRGQLKPGKRVRDCFTQEQLAALRVQP